MLKTFTRSEMLTYWKRRLGLKASPVVAGETDLTEVDRKLLDDIDIWYDDVLLSAPVDKLPVRNVAADVIAYYVDDNSAEIAIPDECIRLVSIKMNDWDGDEPETYSVYSDIARLQRNRLTRATTDEPVVMRRPGRLVVCGLNPPVATLAGSDKPAVKHEASLERLEMVVRPPEGTYVLDRTLLKHSQLTIH